MIFVSNMFHKIIIQILSKAKWNKNECNLFDKILPSNPLSNGCKYKLKKTETKLNGSLGVS